MVGIRSLPKGSSKGTRERRDTATARTKISVKHTIDGFLGGADRIKEHSASDVFVEGPVPKEKLARRKKTSAA